MGLLLFSGVALIVPLGSVGRLLFWVCLACLLRGVGLVGYGWVGLRLIACSWLVGWVVGIGLAVVLIVGSLLQLFVGFTYLVAFRGGCCLFWWLFTVVINSVKVLLYW